MCENPGGTGRPLARHFVEIRAFAASSDFIRLLHPPDRRQVINVTRLFRFFPRARRLDGSFGSLMCAEVIFEP